ncbi:hypothetical protein Ddye_006165 [Dipteronia dyeriana]|uniref:Zinc finger PMZ-type domain-containing protein n=1 Tax=Dipteronia dyeriana TaxID=168575 RepID=A0AAD9XHU2_9ROSI|nr:hypothetical protein Ddye_006165 [Dipteronia dyeriana]
MEVGDAIGNDTPPRENTQQLGSCNGSNQVFTRRSETGGRENMCVIPFVVADHANVVGPQFDNVFDCQIAMNDGQYNEQYNHVENTEEVPVQIKRRGKRVHGVSCSAPDMPGTSRVRHNVTAYDSDNASTLQQQDDILMGSKDIIADMKTMYNIKIMYSKAHQVLHYALVLTYGTHEESFQLLPTFGYVLTQQNHGTITDLQCIENVIAVDGTHLRKDSGGTMFVTIAQDENEHMFPIAFGPHKSCTCNKFQMDIFPCSRALATVRERNLDFTYLCMDFYKRQTLIDAYLVPIMHVGHYSSWVVPCDITERVVLNPISKRQVGCQMAGQHASSSERTTTQSCRRMGYTGNDRRSQICGVRCDVVKRSARAQSHNGVGCTGIDRRSLQGESRPDVPDGSLWGGTSRGVNCVDRLKGSVA